MEYNEAQSAAVSHRDGPMMVLAGPGSGKTMVITGRTRTLIEEYGVPPEQILVITFTKAAAAEMRDRFSRMMGGSFGVRFSTFHSVFFLILRTAYGYTAEQIIREEEQYAFLRRQIEALSLEIADEKDFVRDLLSEISLVKSEELDLEHYYSMNCPEDSFQTIFHAYEVWLREQNRIDFDDMMLLCKELFLARPDILSGWQNRFRYILIDEFQDINLLQYRLVRLMAAPQDNLFIVGDDDQSIYRFRGANPEIMLHFPEDYPQARRIVLDRNYRSTAALVKAAGRIIRNNRKRFAKELRSASGEPGVPPKIAEYADRKEENKAIVEQILRFRSEGVPLSDIAVLFRTSLEARPLAETLMEYNVPFRMKENIPNPYEHWICLNILSYLELARLAAAPADGTVSVDELSELRRCLLQVMNRPNRYLTRDSLPDTPAFLQAFAQLRNSRQADGRPNRPFNLLHLYLDFWKASFRDKDWMAERLTQLENDLRLLASLAPASGIHYIRNVIGYDGFLKSYAEYRRISEEDLTAQLSELSEGAKPFSSLSAWKQHMREYGEELRRQKQNKTGERSEAPDAVVLSTMHASKGLEYEVVFLPDAVEGITPHKKARKEEDMEEERRLFYVAVTRAKHRLYLSTVKSLYGKPRTPSRFLGELRMSAADLKPGSQVVHKTYGPGVVRSLSGGRISIWFERTGKERTLDLKFCITSQLLRLKEAE